MKGDNMTEVNDPSLWWKQAVVYQVYPRSFKDSRGEGLGQIAGVTEKIGYLKELGVDAIWLSPFYPSQLADGGYDVDDYRNVDPKLGTMDDFDALAKAAHADGIKIVVDIVPNHSSNLHEWFKAALTAKPGSPERDRYIFRDGKGPNGDEPPTNWQNHFGGPAWTRVPDGQWYLHMFTKEQPDWNWKNEDVRADFIKTLRFWLDHGADGFRVDVAHGLAKDLDRDDLDDYVVWCTNDQPEDGSHPVIDRDEVHDIYHEWRKVFNEYDPPAFAVAEAWVRPSRQHLYASPDDLGQIFNFEFAKKDWIRDDMHLAIEVIAGKGVGRRAGLGVEGEGVALGRLAHFVLQEMRRTGGQCDLFAVQLERAVDGAEARGVNRVDAAVARHRAAEHGQAAGQNDAFTADGGSGARLGSGEALVIVIQHPRCLPSPACPARRSRRSRPNSCSSAASGAPRPN